MPAPAARLTLQRTLASSALRSRPPGAQEPVDIAATVPEMVGGACSLAFCCWYYAKKHWLANNLLGIAFSIQGIEHLSLGAVSTGVILLSGLFVYDIFWVFCTPVMVRRPALSTLHALGPCSLWRAGSEPTSAPGDGGQIL